MIFCDFMPPNAKTLRHNHQTASTKSFKLAIQKFTKRENNFDEDMNT